MPCIYSMQASYLNTTNPDFISGHKAMAIVTDRMNASRPATPTADPRNPRTAASVVNNDRDLGVDPVKDDKGLFGFFGGKNKRRPNSAAPAAGEPV